MAPHSFRPVTRVPTSLRNYYLYYVKVANVDAPLVEGNYYAAHFCKRYVMMLSPTQIEMDEITNVYASLLEGNDFAAYFAVPLLPLALKQ